MPSVRFSMAEAGAGDGGERESSAEGLGGEDEVGLDGELPANASYTQIVGSARGCRPSCSFACSKWFL